jgi:stalled ribosome rescue protein Dom34
MENTNQIGIWMDHSIAYLMEFNTMPFEIQIIECDLTVDEKKSNPYRKKTKNRDIKRKYKYYNQIGNAIINYDKIILFGPSEAKIDFFDTLSEDERFYKLKIEIKETDKMNVNQQHAFITQYFVQ